MIRLLVGLITFGIGITAAALWLAYRGPARDADGLPLCSAAAPRTGIGYLLSSRLPVIPYCDLIRESATYSDQLVCVRGIYSFNMENSGLNDPACRDEQSWTWVESEPSSNFDASSMNLKRDQPADAVFLGRLIGPNDEGYGHLNGYRYKLLVVRVDQMKPLPQNER
jgi:hypothetical protein